MSNEVPKHQLHGRIKSYKSSGNGLTIEGFANAATVDRGKELIDVGAWTKNGGLNNFMKNPTILFDHGLDPNVGGLPIGKATEVTPTDNGLFIKIRVSQSKDAPISTIRDLIEEGNLRAFSVGFNPDEVEPDNEKGINVIKSAELYEVSVVGLPMNQDSLFQLTNKGGRKRCVKSVNQIKSLIAKDKGCPYAERVNLAMDKPETDRKTLIEEIATKAHVSVYTVYDLLNGDLDTTPKNLKHAITDVLDIKSDDDTPEEKKTTTKVTGKGSGDNSHTHEATFDNETGNGETTSTEGDGPDHKHTIKEFEILSGGEDNHTHPTLKSKDKPEDDDKPKDDDKDKDKDKKDDDKPSAEKDFQECVNEKIPKLIEEGKDQDEAVAVAIDFCRGKEKCTISPSREMYAEFFKTAEQSQSKQADQGTSDEPTTPIDTSAPEHSVEQPLIDQQKQTNVLLGSMVNEFKLFRDSLSGMTEELSAAIRNLVNTLEGKTGVIEGSKNDDDGGNISDSDSDLEKRLITAKNYLKNLDERLKNIGADY